MTSMLNQRTRAGHATVLPGPMAAAPRRRDGLTRHALIRSGGSGIAFAASSAVAATTASTR